MLSACRQTNYGKFKIKTILFGLCVDNSNIHPHTLENSAGMGFKVMKNHMFKVHYRGLLFRANS